MADLADFEEEVPTDKEPVKANQLAVGLGTHAATALGGFKDFCLKSELARAITENGFEHPSEVQHQALPQALLGTDILGQAKSGMGKTAVFVFAVLEQLEKPADGADDYVQALVVVHTRELAFQIDREFNRFNKYLPHCKTAVFFGGVPEEENARQLKNEKPSIVVGTPGRLKNLIQKKSLKVDKVRWFVADEFDRCLEDLKMRRDVQEIFLATPKEDKQVMMFSATMTPELRTIALKFMKKSPTEIYVDQKSKLTLHGLVQYHMDLEETQKLRKLCDILDVVDFNQCIIFTRAVDRCEALNQQLVKLKFPSQAIHSGMDQADRLKVYENCKHQRTRLIVATDIFGRGIDIDRINLVVQYDMASDPDSYLHRVGRAGRFGTKGLTITFLTTDEHKTRDGRTWKDGSVMEEVQSRFEVKLKNLTDIKEQLGDPSQYMDAATTEVDAAPAEAPPAQE